MIKWLDLYTDTEGVFARPTLTLLHKQTAVTVLAVFRGAFPRESNTVPVSQFRQHVTEALEVLAGEGKSVPDHSSAELCRVWVSEGWLLADTDPDLGEVYRLTAASVDAVTFIKNATARRLVSVTRVTAILDAIESMANDAAADRGERIAQLDQQISLATVERDRLLAGGTLPAATVDDMIERHSLISGMVASLPADFRRVGELVDHEQQALITRALAGGEAAGAMIGDALTGIAGLPAQQEWRSFQGVRHLLVDAAAAAALRRNIERILAHPYAEALSPTERRSFADIESVFPDHVPAVLDGFRRLTRTIRSLSERFTMRGDTGRALTEALAAAKLALKQSPRRRVSALAPPPSRIDIAGVTRRLYDPVDAPPPPPLAPPAETDLTGLSLADLRLLGGPQLAYLRGHLAAALAHEQRPITLAEVWNRSGLHLRRPVEMIGYLLLAHTDPDAAIDPARTDTITAQRPDGSRRDWAIPRVVFHLRATPETT